MLCFLTQMRPKIKKTNNKKLILLTINNMAKIKILYKEHNITNFPLIG